MSACADTTWSRDVLAPPGDVTRVLLDWNRGDPEALNELVSLVFADLRRLARKCMGKERVDHTLQPTALVHELFLKLSGQRKVDWENRTQFFSFAAQLMRNLLVDHARRRSTEKRGQGVPRLSLDEALGVPSELGVELEALDQALSDLARLDPRQSRIVELRFFAGLSVDEVREVLGCSRATVIRDWRTAKLWLLRYLRER
jgi:RNA polymerase sigma factor (TIGR02999 family)